MSNNSNPNGPIKNFLDNLSYRNDCPTSDQLLDYDLDLLASEERGQIKQHIDLCDNCCQELGELRAISLESIMMPSVAEKPEKPEKIEKSETLLDAIQEWLRQLVPDKPLIPSFLEPSRPMPAMALRGETEQYERVSQQSIYNANTYRCSLRITPGIVAQTAAQVDGHIMNRDDPDEDYMGSVHLIREQTKEQECAIDEFGFFNLDEVEAGEYTLLLELNAHTIWVQSVMIP